MCYVFCVLFKQKTAYEMRISDGSSDVCSSDLSTTIPLGTWVMRIADSVLLTCWPPAPDERKASTLRSAGLISIGGPSSSTAMIATVAAEVWIDRKSVG